MRRTNFPVSVSRQDANAAQPHVERRGRGGRVPFLDVDNVGPAGSINSTVGDLARRLQFLLDGGRLGRRRPISEKALREMHSPQMVSEPSPYAEIQQPCYGLGWRVMAYRGQRMLSHLGGIRGFASRVTLLPDHGVGVAGRRLVASFHGMKLPLRHYHYDTFEMAVPDWGGTWRATFAADGAGRVASVAVPLQEGVADIVFGRAAE